MKEIKTAAGIKECEREKRKKILKLLVAFLLHGRSKWVEEFKKGEKINQAQAERLWPAICYDIQQFLTKVEDLFLEPEVQDSLEKLYIIYGGPEGVTKLRERLCEVLGNSQAEQWQSRFLQRIRDNNREFLLNAMTKRYQVYGGRAVLDHRPQRRPNGRTGRTKNVSCPKCKTSLVVRPGQSKKVKCLKCNVRWKVNQTTGQIIGQL